MSDTPTLVVLVGLPGSGKSYRSNAYMSDEKNKDTVVYSTDDYIEQVAARRNMTYSDVFQDTIKEATMVNDAKVADAFAAGKNVAWDQTNLGLKKRKQIISKAPKNYRVSCVCFVPPRDASEDAEIAARRDARGAAKFIPKHILDSMKKSAVMPTLEEGFDTVHFVDIYGNPLPHHEVVAAFERAKNES
jgi:predicted kinase